MSGLEKGFSLNFNIAAKPTAKPRNKHHNMHQPPHNPHYVPQHHHGHHNAHHHGHHPDHHPVHQVNITHVSSAPVYPNLQTAPVTQSFHPAPPADNGYSWVPSNRHSSRSLETKAVLVGHEAHDGSQIYVGRAWHEGDLLPCKIIPRHSAAYICYDGKEISIDQFEMYCRAVPSVVWRSSGNGSIPPGAVSCGSTKGGEPLYLGRASYMGSLTPGKVQASHGCCYIPFGGQEVSMKSYEVMTLQHN